MVLDFPVWRGSLFRALCGLSNGCSLLAVTGETGFMEKGHGVFGCNFFHVW